MTSGGEPLTPAKAEAIAASGARAIPSYHMSEVGAIGRGCPPPPLPTISTSRPITWR